ncbi:Uu.00g047470.m01.CDS01 [Anthostomella pinea]|uniref:Uu.00g047470.m01.CDS01 n=1 Tax=Anthostomella pinea TaxID=933095 RepID=A0AAI8VBF3_9PEZI|nr:Uu.00g047470.m01.CDS01 [Anthostomella pinea]
MTETSAKMLDAETKEEEQRATPLFSNPAAAANPPDRAELPPLRLALLSFGLSVGLFLSFLDTSIVATSLYTIGVEFDDLETVNWVALAYTLSYLGCAVFLARMSDVIGRRGAFLVSYIIFIAFSIACGFAESLGQLIACRALQGIGGSGLYSISMVIFPEVSPPRLQQLLGGVIGMIIAMSSVLGPILGGVFTHYATWRWIFWINAPIGAVSIALFYFTWPKPQYLPDQERRGWRELDYLGSVLLIASAVSVVFAFQSAAGNQEHWTQAIFLAPLIVGLFGSVSLLVWSMFVERHWGDTMAAAIPIRLLHNRAYASAVLNTMFLGFPYLLTVYAFPLRLQVVNGKGALMAGVMLLPMLGSSAVGSFLAGMVNGKKDRNFETLIVGTCLMVSGCGLMSTLSDSFDLEAKALGFLVFVGLGFGMTISTATMLTSLHSSIRDHAPAQGIVAQVRVLGGSIGIAASSAILGVTLRKQFGETVSPEELSSLKGSGSGLTPNQAALVRQAYSDAFNEEMRVCAVVAAVAVLFTFGIFSRKRVTPDEHRQQQIRDEVQRRRNAAVVDRPRSFEMQVL